MLNKFLHPFALSLCVVTILPIATKANAVTPLTKAEIQQIRNIVQYIPKNNPQVIPARKSQTITPGDGISTGRASLADLRFNDGSVARVGEQAVFQFLPQTRNFTLSNGTVLLLIPPGRGQTNIKTPNAAAAIRGSALFVQHNSESNTTVIGALTNSGIQVANEDNSQQLTLKAGQLMVVVDGKFQGLYDFDLRTFYQESSLVKGFNLNKQNSVPTSDPSLASVQAETVEAIEQQVPIIGEGTIENPSFLASNSKASGNSSNNNNSNSRSNARNNSNSRSNANSRNNDNNNSNNSNRDFGRSQRIINVREPGSIGRPVDVLIRTGEVIRENQRQRNNPGQGQGNPNPGQGQGNQGGGNPGQGGGNPNPGQGGGNPNPGQGQGNQGGGNPGQGGGNNN